MLNSQQTDAFQGFLRNFMIALGHAAMYSRDHPNTAQFAAAAHASLLQAFGDVSDLSLMIVDDHLVVQGIMIAEGLHVDRFVRTFKARGVEHLSIHHEVTLHEISSLLAALEVNSGNQVIQSLSNIRLGRISLAMPGDGEAQGQIRYVKTADGLHKVCEDELALFQEVFDAVKKHRRLRTDAIYRIVRGLVEAFRDESDSFLSLAPLRAIDEYTFTHSLNVCMMNIAQATALGIDGPTLHDIGVSAILHDIGKLFIPEEILGKQEKLSEQEREIIRQHPLKGAQYLLEAPGVPRLAVIVAYEHHLKFDLSGYPEVSSDWRQNMCSQMTTISDYFDTIRTRQKPLSLIERTAVAQTMRSLSGTDLNPVLTANFLQVLERLSEEEQPNSEVIKEGENNDYHTSKSTTTAS